MGRKSSPILSARLRVSSSDAILIDATSELFEAVERRFEITRRLWGAGVTRAGLTRGQAKQVYLLSGLLVCAECGGSVTLVGGRTMTSRSGYGWAIDGQRCYSMRKNDLTIHL